ncbi:glycosyltransferase family 25 protein [Agaribacter marinus]|uniref:Glycosyl transferase family 25 domain-containing protein n=1 Tax=Agaribacter marinus TaxID=1431249 RepID=A0AA37SWY3_9ALTE|nr:glycosyltransferase family 25 protein [Agaribacter marinus]GLR69116.1 hypothetical protein GCM10007852_00240 [Agaribacter marinus]
MHTDSINAHSLFKPLNDFFDGIFVITLDRAKDRQESIKKNMSGLDYEFWPATDKSKLHESVLHDKSQYDDETHRKLKRTHRSMNLGEYACAHSHRCIHQHMVQNSLQKVLIFEDDAIPNLDVLHNFSSCINSLPVSWDVLMLDYYDCYYENISGYLKQFLYKVYRQLHIANWQHVPVSRINNLLMRHHSEYFYHAGKFSGSHAYCLTLDAAKQYLELQTPVVLQPDRIFYAFQEKTNLNVLACKEPLFLRGEASKVSSIQTR